MDNSTILCVENIRIPVHSSVLMKLMMSIDPVSYAPSHIMEIDSVNTLAVFTSVMPL